VTGPPSLGVVCGGGEQACSRLATPCAACGCPLLHLPSQWVDEGCASGSGRARYGRSRNSVLQAVRVSPAMHRIMAQFLWPKRAREGLMQLPVYCECYASAASCLQEAAGELAAATRLWQARPLGACLGFELEDKGLGACRGTLSSQHPCFSWPPDQRALSRSSMT
jgi:hypothetical protein